jgi:hypothetical protein
MNNKKSKLIRKAVKRNVNDQYRQLLTSLLDSPFLTRLRYAVIIIFRFGYKDLIGGGADGIK